MEVDEPEQTNGVEAEHPGRWSHVRKLLERRGPFSHENFDPESMDIFDMVRDNVNVLVIGEIFFANNNNLINKIHMQMGAK